MLIREAGDRDAAIDRELAAYLATIAGALNAAAFYAVGFFSANMTGNVSSLSGQLATGNVRAAFFYLSMLICFVLGSLISTLVINLGRRRGISRIYAYNLGIEATLLILLAIVDIRFHTTWRTPALVLGLAFLMGLQNAVVTRISAARIRTTHVSGMVTDIGIEMANIFDMVFRKAVTGTSESNRRALWLHISTVLFFLGGGVGGVVIYRWVGGYLLVLASCLLFWTIFIGAFRSRPRADQITEIRRIP